MTDRSGPRSDLPRTDSIRPVARWSLTRLRPLARLLVGAYYRVRIHGTGNVPRSGPVIFAANHVGIADGPFLAVLSPRPVHALTKNEMFRGALGRFLTAAGQIPLDRFHPDLRAVKQSLRTLRDGHAVGIFPEGSRGAGELDLFHRGAAYLAMVSGAPVVPVIFLGTRLPGGSSGSIPPRRSTIHVVFGRPHHVVAHPWPRTREAVGGESLRLRERMIADLSAAQQMTGRRLPGPLPAGQREIEPGGDIEELSA